MRGYNYFDDEPEYKGKNSSRLSFNIKEMDLKSTLDFVGKKAKQAYDTVASGEAFDQVREINRLPNLKRSVIKLSAFALLVITVIASILIFSHSITAQNKKNELFRQDAGKVCTRYIKDYGSVKWEPLDSKTYGKNMARLTGLCYARQMDFDDDGSDELMIIFNNKNIYTLEVWSYVKKEFVKVYSDEVNKTQNEKDGCWVGFYHKGNKYYICKNQPDEPEKMQLFALKGDRFKENGKCDYDYKNDIYSVRGKINPQDFETIKLSVIKSSRAELITDIVTSNIDTMTTISLLAIENQKSPEQLKSEAYYQIVESRNERYGKAKIDKDENGGFINGLAVVRLIDFNNDGNEELLLVYRKNLKESATNYYNGEPIIIEKPTYCMEVYSWNGTVAKKIFSKDSTSNLMSNNNTFYLMLKQSGKSTEICVNTYDYKSEYNYTANSKIYKMNKQEDFETVFNARVVNDYGYKNYYLDGEYTYQSSFNERGYKVPMFLDDNESYGKEFTVIYLSNKNTDNFQQVIDDTVKEIEKLNKNYIAE